MRLFLCAALSAAVLIAAAGCGSDDSPSAPATTASSPFPASTTTTATTTAKNPASGTSTSGREAFLKKVNPICEDYNSEVRAVQAELSAVGKTGNVDVYAPPLRRATKAAKRASERFNAVKPPASETAQAALIGRALDAQVTGNRLLLDAAEADDPQQFGVATEALKQVTPKLQQLMRQYGMTVCGASN